jgi:hypothetical protein
MLKPSKNVFLISIVVTFSALLLILSNSNQSLAQSSNLTNSNQSLAQSSNLTNSNQSLAQSSNLTNSNQSLFSAKGLLVSSKSQGYGIYQERNSNVFRPGEDMILYIEPSGFTYKNLKDDQGNLLYSINFIIGATIYDKNGNYITGPLKFPFDFISHHKNKEISFDFTIKQSSPFPSGDYIVKYTVTDINSGKSFDIVKSIKISNENILG